MGHADHVWRTPLYGGGSEGGVSGHSLRAQPRWQKMLAKQRKRDPMAEPAAQAETAEFNEELVRESVTKKNLTPAFATGSFAYSFL